MIPLGKGVVNRKFKKSIDFFCFRVTMFLAITERLVLMRILFIGDVVSGPGTTFLLDNLWNIRKECCADVVIANGENSADGNGILPFSADRLFSAGVDIITGGNHSFRRREIYSYIDEQEYLLRPVNYPTDVPGCGYCIYTTDRGDKVAVISMLGTYMLDAFECPFKTADRLIEKISEQTKNIIIDFHAEATSEKRAFAEYVAGRVSAVVGTHTHVQTADEKILSDYTGFITDVGMTGVIDSILGVKKEDVIYRFTTKMPTRFNAATGDCEMNGVLIDIDAKTGKCTNIERYNKK